MACYYHGNGEEKFLEDISYTLTRNFPSDFFCLTYMSAVEMRKLIKDLNLKKKLIGEFLYYLCDKKRVQEEKYYLDIMLEEMVLKKI